MKRVLITSMLALGVSCGAALAQTQQPVDNQSGGDTKCTMGTAKCQKGSNMGQRAQGKVKTEEQTQGKANAKTEQQAQGKPGATEQQAQGKAGATTEQQAQDQAGTNCTAGMPNCKKGSKKGEQVQGKASTQTNEQAQGKAGMTTNQQAQGKASTQTNQQAQGKAGMTTNQQAQGKTSTQDNTSTASINNVTVEQKTQIVNVIHETRVEPVSNVTFDISVGVEIPRKKVRLHRLPARIVKIVPAYEGYEYFVLADGRIVIVDPNTLKIVLILT
ncbi:DUF1236 domain-containing protein [Mesorhizobium sp. M0051]|uniref:DUF1236 domain-containing protein n=1 Tax=Mesorhizobium sp. M0051 TaxID=2956862 RepID=UPI00333E12A6